MHAHALAIRPLMFGAAMSASSTHAGSPKAVIFSTLPPIQWVSTANLQPPSKDSSSLSHDYQKLWIGGRPWRLLGGGLVEEAGGPWGIPATPVGVALRILSHDSTCIHDQLHWQDALCFRTPSNDHHGSVLSRAGAETLPFEPPHLSAHNMAGCPEVCGVKASTPPSGEPWGAIGFNVWAVRSR